MFWTKFKAACCATLPIGLVSLSLAARYVQACPALHAEVPFQLYNDNLIVVKGSIGSIHNVNIIVDTGTSPTIVSKHLADRLHLQGNTETQLTLEGIVQVQRVVLPRFEIGRLRTDSLRAVVQDVSFLEPTLGISVGAIAGLDVLSSINFMIDYHVRKIVFGGLTATKRSVHFEKQTPFLTVRAKIEGHEVRLLVDSGAAGIIMYRNRLRPAGEQIHTDSTSVQTAAGMMHSRSFLLSVALGQDDFGQKLVVLADSDAVGDAFDGLLGLRNLGFKKVTFDFENGLFGWE